MFHDPLQTTDRGRDPIVVFERHALQMAIEVARAEGFEGTEVALKELLRALEENLSNLDD